MSYSRSRPAFARRRRRVWVWLLIATVIAVVALAVRLRSERRDISAYLDLAKQVADQEADMSLQLATMLLSLGDMERQDVLSLLATLEETGSAILVDLAAVEVPGAVAEVNGFLSVATAAWADGVAALDEAILLILDEPREQSGEAQLEESIRLLRVGDLAFAGFEDALGELDTELVTREYPAVRYVGDDPDSLYRPDVISARLVAFAELSKRHDIAVTGNPLPNPVGESNNVPVVPFTEVMTVEAVVSNAGNIDEVDVPVTLQISRLESNQPSELFQQTVAALSPGEATTVTFESLNVEPGNLYEVVVRSMLVEDADSENSEWSLVFIVDDPT